MTNTGMFEDAEKIIYLENQNKLLKKKLKEAVEIDKDHQKLNGELPITFFMMLILVSVIINYS